jgi:hypothetical protein
LNVLLNQTLNVINQNFQSEKSNNKVILLCPKTFHAAVPIYLKPLLVTAFLPMSTQGKRNKTLAMSELKQNKIKIPNIGKSEILGQISLHKFFA